ncbi:MAG: M14 family zinc carboxypeptidase [Dokdonella sp.]|uniref:M14 family zinc carboxypeptidase n=1 Tax=Dokdonella sp. TaxID=2291710 RepID=UPI00326396D7
MRRTLLAVAIVVAGLNSAAAEEWVVEAHYPDNAALARAAAHFQHVIVDGKRSTLRVATGDRGIAALEEAGLGVSIDQSATATLNAFYAHFEQAKAQGVAPNSIPGFQCFRTVEETYSTMDALKADHPNIVTIDELGPTWKKSQNASAGYEMRALRITNLDTIASDPDRPKMVVFTSIHAREYAPAELGTRFAEWLVDNYGTDAEATWLVDHNDFRMVLQANPDGRKQAERGILWRKNVDEVSGNCDGNVNVDNDGDGIDLNRNFPFHWNITQGVGSDGNVCGETYRGPVKASEPETQNLVQYVAGKCTADGVCSGGVFADHRDGPMNPPLGGDGGAAAPADTTGFFIDIHSNAALVLWPWGDTPSAAPNQSAMRTFGRRIAYFNGYTPEQADTLYPTDGATDDTMYGLLGVPGFTIETDGSGFFEDCASFDGTTAPNNIAALRYAARNLHATYKLPIGPDTVGATGTSDLIATGDPVSISARIDDSRFNQSTSGDSVIGTVRTIASANAYVDQLPWDSGSQAVALTATDGTFSGSVEDVRGTLPAGANLGVGRHMIYVQGTDSAGNAGTPNAAMIDIVSADSVGTLAGTVTDKSSAAPLVATITLANADETHRATSDAATGVYRAHGYPGTYDVHVSAAHHLSEDLHGVALTLGSKIAHDFALYPNCSIVSDDVESGNQGWTAQSPWVIESGTDGDTTKVWNTPDYGDNLNRSLTSAVHDLTGYSEVTLDFDDRCDTESGFDYGHVEYSANNGSTWTALYSCSGQTTWQSHHIELPVAADGAAAFKLRFRLTSDQNANGPGWAVDNIRIEAGGDACRALQQPDDVIFDDGFEGS